MPLRQSPSGPAVEVLSTTDAIENDSTVPSSSASSALVFLDARRIRYLDVLDAPVGLWNFNQTLAAVVGPDLVVGAGSIGFTPVSPGVFGVAMPLSSRLQAPVTPSLAITGDLSVELIIQFNSDNTGMVMLSHGSSVAGSANNTLYQLSRGSNITPRPLVFGWMNGNKAAQSFSTPTASLSPSVPMQHNLYSLGWRRQSNVLTPFINGKRFSASSSVQPAPTGGSTGFLQIGAAPGGTATGSFAFLSIAIYDYARSDSQWIGSYNRSIGEGLGFIT